jgi:hypothetical protein
VFGSRQHTPLAASTKTIQALLRYCAQYRAQIDAANKTILSDANMLSDAREVPRLR